MMVPMCCFLIVSGLGVWMLLVLFGLISIAEYRRYADRTKGALKCNLTAKDQRISTNIPMLFAHLRQLEAAGQVLKQNALQSCAQSRVFYTGKVSSLALMHALSSHAKITGNLAARLWRALLKCTGVHIGTIVPGQSLADATTPQLNVVQDFMQNSCILSEGVHWDS